MGARAGRWRLDVAIWSHFRPKGLKSSCWTCNPWWLSDAGKVSTCCGHQSFMSFCVDVSGRVLKRCPDTPRRFHATLPRAIHQPISFSFFFLFCLLPCFILCVSFSLTKHGHHFDTHAQEQFISLLPAAILCANYEKLTACIISQSRLFSLLQVAISV